MKQTLKYTVVFLAGALFATVGSAYGAETIKTISVKLRPDIKVSVNGKQLDAAAISYNNTTYLPLRKAAEAVNGKIELNGSNINIVTSSKASNDSSNGTNGPSTGQPGTEISEESYSIEGKVLYDWKEVYLSLSKNNRPLMTSGVVNGETIVYYQDSKYYSTQNTDYYYDPENDKRYYTRDFLLQFLPITDLNGLQTFIMYNSEVTPT